MKDPTRFDAWEARQRANTLRQAQADLLAFFAANSRAQNVERIPDDDWKAAEAMDHAQGLAD